MKDSKKNNVKDEQRIKPERCYSLNENKKIKINQSNKENKNFQNFEQKLKKNKAENKLLKEENKLKTSDNFYKSNKNKSEIYRNINNSTANFNKKTDNNNNNLLAFQEQCAKEYERMLKTFHQNRQTNNPINSREVNYKMLESDIFWLKNTDEEKKNFNKEKYNYNTANTPQIRSFALDSDIFNIKNNENSIKKIGETSLLKNRKVKDYHPSQKSNSEWTLRQAEFSSYVNHHSCEYDIVKPQVNSKINTKEILCIESKGENPAKRQKGLSEFQDLLRIGMANPNKEFRAAFKNNEKIFLKNDNMCNDFLNLHYKYKNICERPFIKEKI